MNEVVKLGMDAEYFASDYDQVHCKHGVFIGYPGGADHMCGDCEAGHDTQYEGTLYVIMWGEEQLNVMYRLAEVEDWLASINQIIEDHNDDDPRDPIVYVEGTYMYWGPAPTKETI